MCERGHTHIQANCAIARKLAARTWAVLQTGQPYEHRDLDDNPIDETTAVNLALRARRPHRSTPPQPRHQPTTRPTPTPLTTLPADLQQHRPTRQPALAPAPTAGHFAPTQREHRALDSH